MAKLLPSSPSADAIERAGDAEPRVIGVDSDDADALMSALSSGTARKLLAALHEEPDTASGLADRIDTTLQNVQYHLGKLDDAEVVSVVDTVYSEKGREMKVYAPADRPLVVFAGREADSTGLVPALKRLLGAVGALAVGSVLVESLLAEGPPFGFGATGGAEGGSAGTMEATGTAADAAGQAMGLPPGLLFFLGGLAVLLAAFAVRYVRRTA
ncbi:ArsR/SmtB family transcription factor [Halobium salinum]|uniref:ArsR/SmtB family transcription factor n=1 Tax=Halobium salinum TaxID=1364940 RepID=A0ABD5P7K9_9EURY|nr:winged helix-turn-helix domain-containing protein [Halobium salinum]